MCVYYTTYANPLSKVKVGTRDDVTVPFLFFLRDWRWDRHMHYTIKNNPVHNLEGGGGEI